MKNGAAGKKKLRYSLDGAVSNPLPQGTPVQPQGDLVMVGGRSGFGTPPPLFFPSPKNWLFCMSGLIQTRGIFSRAPLSPCEPLKRSRDGGKKSAGKKFIFPNLGTGTGFRNRPDFRGVFFFFLKMCVHILFVCHLMKEEIETKAFFEHTLRVLGGRTALQSHSSPIRSRCVYVSPFLE